MARIWNDLRFVESWFQQKLSTEEILKFFEFWGVDIILSNLSEGKSYLRELDNHQSNYEKIPILRLYIKNDLSDFQFILVFQQDNRVLKFTGSNEEALRSNLKSIFGLAVREYREAETFNQITQFESKVLSIVRSLKGSKFANLIKSRK
jgi:hypothetical protein